MIEKVEMYACVCDRCGKTHVDEFNGFVAWTDGSSARESASEYNWTQIDGKDYCPDCYILDEELDEYRPKRDGE